MRVPSPTSSSNSKPALTLFQKTRLILELVGLLVVITFSLLTLVPSTGTSSVDQSSCADRQLTLWQNAKCVCTLGAVVDTDDSFDEASDNDQIDLDETIGLASADSGLMIRLLASFDRVPGCLGLLHVGEDSPLHSPRAPPALS